MKQYAKKDIPQLVRACDLVWIMGTGDGWNCHTLAGLGLRLDPVCGGSAWDWFTNSEWWHGVASGQTESRDEAAQAALESLIVAGLDVSGLPRDPCSSSPLSFQS